jgi:tetratricopeptide (TPR) repeat protein
LADEWYRTPDWSPAGQAEFERRLARARNYNRSQYLRIKGIHLREAGNVDGARTLWECVLTSTDEFVDVQRPSALEHLGDSYCDEDPDRAEEFYRRLLAEYPTLNATTHTVEIALAELLIKMRRYDEALELLNSFLERKTAQFPNILFRWHLALIDIASAMREKETVQRAARVALELADRGPVFPRHKDVGIVHADKAILRRLKRLAK